MTNEDYIKAAIGLIGGEITDLDGGDGAFWCQVSFPHLDGDAYEVKEAHSSWQWFRDLLAAQLVRQSDEVNSYVTIMRGNSEVRGTMKAGYKLIASHASSDRTMNTIKAIVDSEVLSEQDGS